MTETFPISSSVGGNNGKRNVVVEEPVGRRENVTENEFYIIHPFKIFHPPQLNDFRLFTHHHVYYQAYNRGRLVSWMVGWVGPAADQCSDVRQWKKADNKVEIGV